MRVSTALFGGLTISYDERVLSPRTWTLQQSLWALELLDDLPDGPILELCAGAGQIGLAVAAGCRRRLVCVDADPAAVHYSTRNAVAAGCADRVETRLGRLREALRGDERFPLILADPPWVPRADVARFPDDPVAAIDGGPEGLDVAGECLSVMGTHLAADGRALLQLGAAHQVDALAEVIEGAGLRARETRAFGDRGVVVLLSH